MIITRLLEKVRQKYRLSPMKKVLKELKNRKIKLNELRVLEILGILVNFIHKITPI